MARPSSRRASVNGCLPEVRYGGLGSQVRMRPKGALQCRVPTAIGSMRARSAVQCWVICCVGATPWELRETRRNAAFRSAIRCFEHLGSAPESRVSHDLDGLANLQSRMARANGGYQLADGDNFGVRPDGCPGVGSVDIRPTKRCRSGGVSYGGSWRSQIHRAGTRSARRW